MVASSAVEIESSDQPLDISFHPSKPTLLATALVDGTIEFHDFKEILEQNNLGNVAEDEIDSLLSSTAVHTQMIPTKSTESGVKQASARAVAFSNDGAVLYTGGSAGDFACLDAELLSKFTVESSPRSLLWRVPDATYTKSPLQVVYPFPDSNSLVATGDEAGGVRIWDTRLMGRSQVNASKLPLGCVHSWKEHDDYVSGITYNPELNMLLASSADCTISVYDLRAAKQVPYVQENVVRRSDDQEDELLSIQIMKNGKKVVCGSGEGVLAVWSWGTWGDISDRFPGHPTSVDALLKVDEDTLLTGASDGLIRVVQIHPDKLLGVLGDHNGFPIEKLAFNATRDYVGSITHDAVIRIWDARILKEDYADDNEGEEIGDVQMRLASVPQVHATARDSDDEWDDMDEKMDDNDEDDDSTDEDDDDDSDSDDSKPKTKNDKRSGRFKSENEKFFQDL